MGKFLQIRVSAWTYREEDVADNWPNLCALAWPAPPRPGEKRGVLELAETLHTGILYAGWNSNLKKLLAQGIDEVENIRNQLENALANWEPRAANKLSERLEEILTDLEDIVPRQ